MTVQTATPTMLATDWGGTWCRMALVDRLGEVLWQARRPNPRGGSAAMYLALADELLAEAWGQREYSVEGIGVAVAGPVDPSSGILHQPPNLMALDGVSLKQVWSERYGVPVAVGNDANLAALGEYSFGAGRDAAASGRPPKCLFYVTVSTGIGGGVIADGRMLLGANGLTAEVGHTVVDTSAAAPLCQCGKVGCLEAVSSGTAIAIRARSAVASGEYPDSALATLPADSINGQAVVEAAMQGDELALSVMGRAVDGLGVGLANAVHLYNPDLIVLGGGVSEGFRGIDLLPSISSAIKARLMSELHKAFDLTPSALGDNPGLLGAAAAGWAELDGA